MFKTKIFRALALINFVILVTVFLLYRNGTFDKMFREKEATNLTSTSNETVADIQTDSLPASRDSLTNSTKTPTTKTVADTTKAKKTKAKAAMDSAENARRTLMYSSKSAIIVEPLQLDSMRKKAPNKPKQ